LKSLYFLIAIAILLLFFLVQLFDPFLKPIFVATLLTIATNSLFKKMNAIIKNNAISTSILTLLMASLFFLPILYCIISFVAFFNQVDQSILIDNLNSIKNSFIQLLAEFSFLNDFTNKITSQIDISKIVQTLVSFSANLGKDSAKFMIDMILILIFFLFFTLYSSQIAQYLKHIIPINNDDANILLLFFTLF